MNRVFFVRPENCHPMCHKHSFTKAIQKKKVHLIKLSGNMLTIPTAFTVHICLFVWCINIAPPCNYPNIRLATYTACAYSGILHIKYFPIKLYLFSQILSLMKVKTNKIVNKRLVVFKSKLIREHIFTT